MTKFIYFLFLLTLFNMTIPSNLDMKIEENRQKLEAIYNEINKQQSMINKTDKRAKELADELKSIDSLLKQQNELLVRIEEQLKAIEKETEWLEKELGIDKQNFSEIINDLNNKYFNYYKLSNSGFIEQLVEHNDLTNQINILYMLEYLISMDVQFLNETKKKSTNLKYKGYRLEAQINILSERQEAIHELKKNIEANKEKKRNLHKQLLEEKNEYEKNAERLLADSRKVEEHVIKLQKESKNITPLGDGKFIWPVIGSITSEFGYRTHPILGSKIFHTGLDIGAPAGRPVFAVDVGVVIYSGGWGNYGNVVMIDHGDSLTTLYAHLSRNLVKKGYKIAKGQVVGLIGQTGLATGPHLHFEVRKNGKVENPLQYLPKK
jgi:murein DD-endopeptidase MepM/ murein hydrolase activator NlpD